MAGEAESHLGKLVNYLFSRNYRILLLLVIAIMMVVLLWHNQTTSLNTPSDTQPKSLKEQLKVQLEALPPIPVKVIIEQIEKNDTKNDSIKWNYNWDLREWKHKSDMIGVPSRTIYLIRHGQYNLSTGHLNNRGHEQAKLTAQRLKAMDKPFGNIYYSTHDRTRETAKHIAEAFPGIPLISDDMLREGGPVAPSPPLSFWHPPERDYFVDGPRLESTFRKYFYRADKSQQYQSFDIIVAHANIIRFMVLRALQVEPSAWMRIGISHASVTSVTVNPDSFVLLSKLGEAGHLPVDMVTY